MKKTLAAFILILILGFAAAKGCRSLTEVLYPQRYADIVEKYSAEYDVDKELIYAVIRTESSFRTDARSGVGASGLMQIMPETLDWLNMRMGTSYAFEELQDADTAIRCGTYMLRFLLEDFGDTDTAIAAYHAGRTCVHWWLQRSEYSADGKTLRNIPYRDTAHYVQKVDRAMRIYQNLYEENTD